MSMLAELVDVVIGVDTHKHTHTAAAVAASTGAALEELNIQSDLDGYQALVDLADRHSESRVWAIEGTASYGTGLTRFLTEAGETVIEIDRPDRSRRRGGAKTDEIDAVRAAREALGREQLAQPRARSKRSVLALRLAARRSAIKASSDTQHQLNAMIVTAPEALRDRFRRLTPTRTLTTAVGLRVSTKWDLETRNYAEVLRSLAKRVNALKTEAAGHTKALEEIIKSWRPDLLEERGVGPVVAATILCAWSHPGRCRNEAAFASLAGVAPIPASSGQTTRHRLCRHGDRQLNRALHVIVLCRLNTDPETIAYAQRRRAEGKTDREIKRSLKRYIARRIYNKLEHGPNTPT